MNPCRQNNSTAALAATPNTQRPTHNTTSLVQQHNDLIRVALQTGFSYDSRLSSRNHSFGGSMARIGLYLICLSTALLSLAGCAAPARLGRLMSLEKATEEPELQSIEDAARNSGMSV